MDASTVGTPGFKTQTAAVARQEGVGTESLRQWVVQADIDAVKSLLVV
ncbi:hypothetical protein [Microbacterium sp. AK031]|nr:hypothetical protein [Microbacterium sp. AK031]MCS3842366.1 transposase-like protein [Microbacterium sp. AK031]